MSNTFMPPADTFVLPPNKRLKMRLGTIWLSRSRIDDRKLLYRKTILQRSTMTKMCERLQMLGEKHYDYFVACGSLENPKARREQARYILQSLLEWRTDSEDVNLFLSTTAPKHSAKIQNILEQRAWEEQHMLPFMLIGTCLLNTADTEEARMNNIAAIILAQTDIHYERRLLSPEWERLIALPSYANTQNLTIHRLLDLARGLPSRRPLFARAIVRYILYTYTAIDLLDISTGRYGADDASTADQHEPLLRVPEATLQAILDGSFNLPYFANGDRDYWPCDPLQTVNYGGEVSVVGAVDEENEDDNEMEDEDEDEEFEETEERDATLQTEEEIEEGDNPQQA